MIDGESEIIFKIKYSKIIRMKGAAYILISNNNPMK